MLKKLQIHKFLVIISAFLIPFYFFRFSILGLRTNIFEVLVSISFLASVIYSYRVKKKIVWGSIWPYIFLLIVLLSIILSNNKSSAFGIFKGWFFVPVVFYWLVINNFKQKDLRIFSIPIFISLIAVSFWAIFQRLGLISELFYQLKDNSFAQYFADKRAFGPFESPNFLAMFIVPAFFLSLPIIGFFKTGYKKILIILLLASSLIALLLSGSKGGFWAFGTGVLVYLNYRYINKQRSKDRRPLFTSLLVASLLIINSTYFYIFTHLANLSGSNEARKEIYQYSFQLLEKNLFTGIGLGNFQSAITAISVGNNLFINYVLPYALHPHNLLLAIWLNLGILGLVIFIVLLINFLKDAFSSDSPMKSIVLASMIAVIVHGLFDTTYFKNDLSAIFWLILSYSVIISRQNENKETNN